MTTNSTLAELAIAHPGATRIFLKHGLDFCCGGGRALDQVCAENNLDPQAIIAEIAAEDAAGGAVAEWASRPLGELVDFIEDHYHKRLRAELPELITMAQKVERAHGKKANRPRNLVSQLETMHGAILDHLTREEQVLFPMIRAGYRHQVSMPIRVMEQEHEDHGKDLNCLRELTHNFTAPQEACPTWKALYLRLNRLADELMEHIHLENNVLFPRAICE